MTHQVHDEVQLDGEVHNEEDAGPWAPGVGRHHHVWKAALQRLTSTSKDAPCSCSPAVKPPPLPSTQPRVHRDGGEPREEGDSPGLEGGGQSQRREWAQAYLAVVRRTNRLTMLFSKVLKYYKEGVGMRGRPGQPHPGRTSPPSPFKHKGHQSRGAASTQACAS